MAKSKTVYVCSSCGEESITWQGRCPTCGEWNTMREIKIVDSTDRRAKRSATRAISTPRKLSEVVSQKAERTSTGLDEFDRVLGGGIIPGSVILIGGEPGIGKSTLLIQVADALSAGRKVLYCSGEESEFQVADRARRLGLRSEFMFTDETNVGEIIETILAEHPDLVIIDSIHTLYDDRYPSTPGSLVQVRECALQLQELAKRENISTILVGHITKEGTLAGPKTLEHMVDVVLSMEGEPKNETRLLRSMKNRFGATYEVGIFALDETGLKGVTDPSLLFVQEHSGSVPGTSLTVVLEGLRPIVMEVQALVLPTSFGYPKRTALGVDLQHLHILLAILDRRTGASFSSSDVFVNVVGGYHLQDRGADSAICMALLSAATGVPLPARQIFYGEVGLTGEIRSVTQQKRRDEETKRLGYTANPKTKSLRLLAEEFNLTKKDRHAS